MKDPRWPATQTTAAASMMLIPTGIEAILSPRSKATYPRSNLTEDQCYDERRSLRREWIRFMDSLDSDEEEGNNHDHNDNNNESRDQREVRKHFTTGDVELCYPTVTNTNTCRLDEIFSGEFDDNNDDFMLLDDRIDEDRQGASEEDDAEVLHIFRSLKDQVDHLDGILEEFSDLGKSPNSTNTSSGRVPSSPISKQRSILPTLEVRGLKAHEIEDCDTFEDEWQALKNLEKELRQELKSVSIEMDTMCYGVEEKLPQHNREGPKNLHTVRKGDCDQREIGETFRVEHHDVQLKTTIQSKTLRNDTAAKAKDSPAKNQPSASLVTPKTAAATCHIRFRRHSRGDKSPVRGTRTATIPAAIPFDGSSVGVPREIDVALNDGDDLTELTSIGPALQKEQSTSKMFIDCVFNTELSCTPRACAGILEEEKDAWDFLAYNPLFSGSDTTQPESLLTERNKSLTPIFEMSGEDADPSSPLPMSSANVSSVVMSRRNLPEAVSTAYRFSASELKKHTHTTSELNTEDVVKASSMNSKTPRSTSSPQSEGLVVSPLVGEDITLPSPTTVEMSHVGGTTIPNASRKAKPNPYPAPLSYTIRVPAYSPTAAERVSTSTGHDNIAGHNIAGEQYESPVEDSKNCDAQQEEKNILMVATTSASTLTNDEPPVSGSINSHDVKLNEILLEEEIETDRDADSKVIEHHKNDEMNSDQMVLQEILSENNDSGEDECDVNASLDEGKRVKLPIVAKNVRDGVLWPRTPPFRSTSAPEVASRIVSSAPSKKNVPFLSPNLSFELDAISDGSLDLMTISADDVSRKGQKPMLGNPKGMDELSILSSESSESDESPLILPLVQTNSDEADRKESGGESIDHVVGRLYARTKAGGVLVLDEALQASLARIATRAVQEDPIKFKNTVFDESNLIYGEVNGIETVLKEDSNPGTITATGCCPSDPIANLLLRDFCCGSNFSSPSNGVKIISGGENIELIHCMEETETYDENSIVSVGSKPKYFKSVEGIQQTDEYEISKEGSAATKDALRRILFWQSQRLLESIISRDFDVFSELTTGEISGIDFRGEIIHGRCSYWDAAQRLTERQPQDNRISMEGSSILQLSDNVVVLIYSVVECKNGASVVVSRETRIWNKVNDEDQWRNCHFHLSSVHPP